VNPTVASSTVTVNPTAVIAATERPADKTRPTCPFTLEGAFIYPEPERSEWFKVLTNHRQIVILKKAFK